MLQILLFPSPPQKGLDFSVAQDVIASTQDASLLLFPAADTGEITSVQMSQVTAVFP